MTKETGLGDRLLVNGYDLSGDVGSIQSLKHTIAEQDVTGINKSAKERLQLLHDGEIGFTNYFTGTASDGGHERLKDLSTTAQATYFRGTTLDGAGAGLVATQFQYQLDRAASGALLGTVSAKASGGVPTEWGRILCVDAFTGAATQSDELDLGASHGIDDMAFYLHVTAFNGTDATIIIQMDTADTFGSPTTYGTFTTVTASHAYQRLLVAGAPERYIRWSVSGTFTDVTFSILACPLFDS